MTDIFSLGLKADTSDLKRGKDALDDLADGAENADSKAGQLRDGVNVLGKAVLAFGATAATALAGITVNAANTAREVDNLSRVSGLSVENFQRTAFAAQAYGVEQEKLADILKDTSDKVGDFLATGAGPMADFFEKVAPQVGVTAENFRDLNGADALQLYVSSLEKANVSQNEMVFYLEAIASDATLLQPLLANNGAELERLAGRAGELGLVLEQVDFQNLKELKTVLDEVSAVSAATSNVIGATLAPYITDIAQRFNEASLEGEDLRDTLHDMVEIGASVVGVFADAGRVFEIFGKSLGAGAFTVVETFNTLDDRIELFGVNFELFFRELDLVVFEWVNTQDAQLAAWANNLLETVNIFGILDDIKIDPEPIDTMALESHIATLHGQAEDLEDALVISNENIAAAWQDVADLIAEPIPSDGLDEWVAGIRAAVEAQRKLRAEVENTVDAQTEGGRKVSALAEVVEDEFKTVAETVAGSLQDAITTGDWSGVGESLGYALADGAASVVSDTLADALGDSASALAGAFAPIGGAIVGGIVGALAAELGDFLAGDVVDPTAGRQAAQGTGSVLGSLNTKTTSIANSNDLIAGATESLVNINRDMLRTLTTLQSDILGVATLTARASGDVSFAGPSINENAFAGAPQIDVSILGSNAIGQLGEFAIDQILGGLVNTLTLGLGDEVGKLLGGSSSQVDEGIRILGGGITELVENGVVEAFASFKARKNILDDYDIYDRFATLGDDVTQQFGLAFSSVIDSVVSGAAAFGVDPDDIQAAIDAFQVETQTISLEGLDAAAQQAEITAVFSKIFDDLTLAVIPNLAEFQTIGEGLGETLARVGTSVQLTSEAAEVLGFTLGETRGDFEALPTNFEGQLEWLNDLHDAVNASAAPVEMLAAAATDLVELTGGIEAFSQALAGYESNFLDTATQTENLGRRLSEAMADLPLPATRDGFRELVAAQSAATESGRENIATLLQLQGTADQYYTALEQDQGAALELQIRLLSTLGEAEEALALTRERELEAATETQRALLEQIYAAEDAAQAERELEAARREAEQEAAAAAREEQRVAQEAAAAARDAAREAAAAERELEAARREAAAETARLAREAQNAFSNLSSIIGDQQSQLRDTLSAELTTIGADFDAQRDAIANRMSDQISSMQRQLSTAERQASALSGLSSTLAGAIGDVFDAGREGAASTIESAIEAARRGQSLAGADLQGAISALTNIDESGFGSQLELQRERGRTADQLTELKNLTDGQLSTAERSVRAIEGQTAAIRRAGESQIEALNALQAEAEAEAQERFDVELAALEEMRDNAQASLNALLGIDEGVKTLAEAQDALAAAMTAVARDAASAAKDDIVYSIGKPEVPDNVVVFPADGGTQADGGTGNSDEVLRSIATSSAKTARLLDRWDGDGQPETRTI